MMATSKIIADKAPVEELPDTPDLADDEAGYDEGDEGTTVAPPQSVTEDSEGTDPGMTKEDRDKALRECYSEAQKLLREKHQDEFNAMRQELAAKRGIDWSPPKSAVQKAEDQVRELVELHPELAERLGIQPAGDE